MKKLTQKFWMWIAGIIVLGMVTLAGFSQGVFFQGNLRFAAETPKETTVQPENPSLQVVAASNQLREGANSFFRVVLKNSKASTLKRLKLNVALHDLTINNVKLIWNGDMDITDQLTNETLSTLNSTLRAPDRQNLDKTFTLAFKEGFKLQSGEHHFELLFNAEKITRDSTLIVGLLDAVLNQDGRESVLEGPVEKVELQTTYSTI